jgi:hypothetical protein
MKTVLDLGNDRRRQDVDRACTHGSLVHVGKTKNNALSLMARGINSSSLGTKLSGTETTKGSVEKTYTPKSNMIKLLGKLCPSHAIQWWKDAQMADKSSFQKIRIPLAVDPVNGIHAEACSAC